MKNRPLAALLAFLLSFFLITASPLLGDKRDTPKGPGSVGKPDPPEPKAPPDRDCTNPRS